MFQIEDLLGSLLRGYVPGFRTGKKWKKVVATLGYLLLLGLLASSAVQMGEVKDKFIFLAQVIFVFSVPFVLLTNFLDLRDRIPFLNRESRTAAVGLLVLLMLWLALSAVFIAATTTLYSDEYQSFLGTVHELGMDVWTQEDKIVPPTVPAEWVERESLP